MICYYLFYLLIIYLIYIFRSFFYYSYLHNLRHAMQSGHLLQITCEGFAPQAPISLSLRSVVAGMSMTSSVQFSLRSKMAPAPVSWSLIPAFQVQGVGAVLIWTLLRGLFILWYDANNPIFCVCLFSTALITDEGNSADNSAVMIPNTAQFQDISRR